MKHIKSVLIVVALFAALSADAKQVGKKTGTTPSPVIPSQPTPPINANRPRPQPQPAPRPQYEASPSYEDIYNSLSRKKTPDISNLETLQNIKNEAEKQISQIKMFVEKKPAPTLSQIENDAKAIFKQYPINLDKTQKEIDDAAKADKEIFTKEEQMDIINEIYNVVNAMTNKFETIDSQGIYHAIITFHPEFLKLAKKLTPYQYKEITTKFIKPAVDNSYNKVRYDL